MMPGYVRPGLFAQDFFQRSSGQAVARPYDSILRLLFRSCRILSVVRPDALNGGRCEHVQRTVRGEGDVGDAAGDALNAILTSKTRPTYPRTT